MRWKCSLLGQCYSGVPCILNYKVFFVVLYKSAVKNASGRSEVRNAKDAIEAYKNITDAINAAEAAANKAKDAAENALNVRKIYFEH